MTDAHLTLHQLFSPAFPVGGFAYSHGLESVIHDGDINDINSLQDWLRDVLEHGTGWSDAVVMAHAARCEDPSELADLALALAPSSERRQETLLQGTAFASTVAQVWRVKLADLPYPVAAGRAAVLLELPLEAAIRIYLQSLTANFVGAGVRLIPLGQTDGQRVVQALSPLCQRLARDAMTATLDDLGGFAPLVDVASMRHETLYSRLFRS